MRFKVGERARVTTNESYFSAPWSRRVAGRQCTVVAIGSSVPGHQYSVEVDGVDPRELGYKKCTFAAKEEWLRKLLPDSDTYHPADISIDDLMRGLREIERLEALK